MDKILHIKSRDNKYFLDINLTEFAEALQTLKKTKTRNEWHKEVSKILKACSKSYSNIKESSQKGYFREEVVDIIDGKVCPEEVVWYYNANYALVIDLETVLFKNLDGSNTKMVKGINCTGISLKKVLERVKDDEKDKKPKIAQKLKKTIYGTVEIEEEKEM